MVVADLTVVAHVVGFCVPDTHYFLLSVYRASRVLKRGEESRPGNAGPVSNSNAEQPEETRTAQTSEESVGRASYYNLMQATYWTRRGRHQDTTREPGTSAA